MDPLVIGLVVASGVLHVAWNVRLKTAGDPLIAATIGMIAATVVVVPVGVTAWWLAGRPLLPPEALALAIASGVVEAGYFVLLSAAYRRGDLSVVYPIARGTAPLIAVAIGIGLLGERLGLAGSIGVALLIVGFLVLGRPWRALRARRVASGRAPEGRAPEGHAPGQSSGGWDPAIGFALAAGVTIALYSAIDRVGTRLIDPLPYAAILWVTMSIVLVAWVRVVVGRPVLGADARDTRRAADAHGTRRAAEGGLLTLAAYLLILVALSVAPLSGVAPLRESAIVLAAAWGSVRLGEATSGADTTRRIVASGLIVLGAILLAIGA